MYKKIAISFLALILVFNFSMKDYADAAIASKAASQAAKQIAKEVIQDIAVETAANFALHQAMDIAGKYEAKQGYKIVCPDGGANCTKPIQVKENITDTDKQAIKGQAGGELDKLLNGGAGVSKWQKFLDWFLPVWLISFGATALTYAFDSDVRSLFNEAGYNALVALGFIIPVDSLEIKDLEDEEIPGVTEGTTPPPPEAMNKTVWTGTDGVSRNKNSAITMVEWRNLVVDVRFETPNDVPLKTYNFNMAKSEYGLFGYVAEPGLEKVFIGNAPTAYGNMDLPHVKIQVDGLTVYDDMSQSGTTYYVNANPEMKSILSRQMKSIQYRAPYEIDGFWYTDVLYNTVDGHTMQTQARSTQVLQTSRTSIGQYAYLQPGTGDTTITATIHTGITPTKKILPPIYDDGTDVVPVSNSNYEDDSGNVALIPPTALTYKEESTGETVYRVPAAIPTEPAQFQKEDGTPVPEENITVDPAPTVTPAPAGSTTEKGEPIPEGTPTVTPAPTPTNPAPAPIPLTPTQPAPDPSDPTTPPANGEEPPMQPLPDGEYCEAKLQFPIFSPLKEQFSTSFPFSIPWDMERAINAAFAEIGNDKPSFTLDLAFMGETKEIVITVPKMFDDWKPFTDTLLLLTFDILIMFGVYRFVKGAGS